MKGKLIGIGVGPGDSELLTVKAVKILNEVKVICSPHTAKNKKSKALSIVNPVIKDRPKEEYEVLKPLFPMVEDKEVLEKHWDDCSNLIKKYLDKGLDVAFITLGDPTIFSTFSYVQHRLEDSYEIEIVPGITSFTACASTVKTPLTEKNEVLIVIPQIDDRFEELAKLGDSLVLMKTSRHIDKLEKVIDATEKKADVITVQNSKQDDEKIINGFSNDKTYFSTSLIKFHK